MMKRYIFLLVLILNVTCLWAVVQGEYTDNAGGKHNWSVNYARMMVWDEKPYTPVGVRLRVTDPLDENRFDLIKKAGLSDVMLEIPFPSDMMNAAVWQTAINACEARGLRYMIGMGYTANGASGYAVEPQTYRMPAIREPITVNLKINNVDTALFCLVDRIDATVVQSGIVIANKQQLTIDLKPRSESECILIVYPHFTKGAIPDYWEGYDAYRDNLLALMKSVKFGANFRGMVDPFGKETNWSNENKGFIPDSPLFRMTFTKYLRKKYDTLEKLNLAWGMVETDLPDYETAVRCVPLYFGNRGIPQLWDNETGKYYRVNSNISKFWSDIKAVLTETSIRRSQGLINSVSAAAHGAPCVYTFTGFDPVFKPENTCGQGLSVSAASVDPEIIKTKGLFALSAINEWKSSGWFIAGDVSPDFTNSANPISEQQLTTSLDWLKELGAKGFFVRLPVQELTLSWLTHFSEYLNNDLLFTTSDSTGFYAPSAACPPAFLDRFAPRMWRLPTPYQGERIDYGPNLNAYWISTPNGNQIYLWTNGSIETLNFRLGKPDTLKAFSLYGELLATKLSKDKVTLKVGTEPIILSGMEDLPVPLESMKWAQKRFDAIYNKLKSGKLDSRDVKFSFDLAKGAAERNPGSGYRDMLKSIEDANNRMATYAWLEGEKTNNHTFGDVTANPAVSNGYYLSVNTPFEPAVGYYQARYEVSIATESDFTLWLGGLPPGLMDNSPVEWIIDGNSQGIINQAPLDFRYGYDFAWFTLGEVKLTRGNHSIVLRCLKNENGYYQAGFDALLLTDKPFQPYGNRKPQNE